MFFTADFVLTNLEKERPGPNKAPHPSRMSSRYFHHDLRPSVLDVTESYGSRKSIYSTNSLGFRDFTNRDVPLQMSKPRILFLGDSFTEGVAVPYEKSFVGRFARQKWTQSVDVLNAGVSSYCPIIYYRKAKHLIEERGLEVSDVFVFLDISDIQDETAYTLNEHGNVQERGLTPWHVIDAHQWGKIGYFLRQHFSLSARVHARVMAKLYPERFQVPPFGNLRGRWTFDNHAWEAYGREGLPLAHHHMNLLHELLNKKNIRLLLAVYPWPNQILEDNLHSRQVKVWKEWASARGVPFLDLFPTFMGTEMDKAESISKYFIPYDFHWSEAGHGLAAQELTKFYNFVGLPQNSQRTVVEPPSEKRT